MFLFRIVFYSPRDQEIPSVFECVAVNEHYAEDLLKQSVPGCRIVSISGDLVNYPDLLDSELSEDEKKYILHLQDLIKNWSADHKSYYLAELREELRNYDVMIRSLDSLALFNGLRWVEDIGRYVDTKSSIIYGVGLPFRE